MTKEEKTIDICGVLVHATKGKEEEIKENINTIDGVNVHYITKTNRLIITIEKDEKGQIMDIIDGFNEVPGVISTILTYQHSEPV
ncbi:MAG: chaperone NapD [Candidatus Ruthia sp.]|jgi:nitrate reductase NapD|nr:chaperone NapD [Candidatus Ruthturnera sp.]MBT4122317.1 chaperone NapD [Candidatus Ruthturnera sp.]MBT4668859.1 chaperone NapD [Candidatus Ruthturnera sp.]MBT6922168.1 chaperone NapD [Candidatus Ruthturnera sp.]